MNETKVKISGGTEYRIRIREDGHVVLVVEVLVEKLIE